MSLNIGIEVEWNKKVEYVRRILIRIRTHARLDIE
jgi:hypothetical protein